MLSWIRRKDREEDFYNDEDEVDTLDLYIVIHFTPQTTYVYISLEYFENYEGGLISIEDKNGNTYSISGNFVYLEFFDVTDIQSTIHTLKKQYKLNDAVIIEIETEIEEEE